MGNVLCGITVIATFRLTLIIGGTVAVLPRLWANDWDTSAQLHRRFGPNERHFPSTICTFHEADSFSFRIAARKVRAKTRVLVGF